MATQKNLNVSLTPRFMSAIRKRVASGRYQSASEVVREGLRLLEDRDREQEAFWAEVRGKVAEGKAGLRAGKGIPSDVFVGRMNAYVRASKATRDRAKTRSGRS